MVGPQPKVPSEKICMKDYLNMHEHSIQHCNNYLSRHLMERAVRNEKVIDTMLQEEIASNTSLWCQILERLLHVMFFLVKRGLPFRGDCKVIGDKCNRLFLGILEVITRYEHVLNAHLTKVRQSQDCEKRELQVHYLSYQSQNEFIHEYSEIVKEKILSEIKESKYYSIILDSTPDSSHKHSKKTW